MAKRLTPTATGGDLTNQHGRELRAIRRYLGWSQHAMATRLGVHPVSLSKWERGAKPVPLTVLRLARYLGLSGVPPAAFAPVVASDPDTAAIALRPGNQCHWASVDCRGVFYTMETQISRRRRVVTEACEGHVKLARQAIDLCIEHKQHPWRRRGRKRQ